jgi:hypothetical protein
MRSLWRISKKPPAPSLAVAAKPESAQLWVTLKLIGGYGNMPGADSSQHWRDRAKQARDRAERMKDPQSKRMLLGLADSYERLAEWNGESLIGARRIAKNGRRKTA